MLKITQESIQGFENHLYLEEKSNATIRKYSKAVSKLHEYLTKRDLELTKGAILEYRDNLKKYLKVQTINGILSAINSYLKYQGQQEYKVKLLKIQQQVFRDESKELTETEYRRLLMTAKNRGDERLYMVMLTIGNTGIRISELKYITLEAVKRGRAEVDLKAKKRIIIIAKGLRKKLLTYAQHQGIRSGMIFITKNGKALDRSNICHSMKKLCREARVKPEKIFPHNLRHLFARVFYSVERNISHLADILGHSNIETTRIYVAVSTNIHEKILSKMQLMI